MIGEVSIYKIVNPVGKIYIGSTIDFNRRIRQYKNLNCSRQVRIYRSLLKYGFENHEVSIIDHCSKENISEKMSKSILCLNHGIYYSSIKECAFYNDIKYSTLVSSLNRGLNKRFITIQNA